MNKNRRNFLRVLALGSTAAAVTPMKLAAQEEPKPVVNILEAPQFMDLVRENPSASALG